MKKRFTLMMMVLCFLMSIPLKMMAETVTIHFVDEDGWEDYAAYVYDKSKKVKNVRTTRKRVLKEATLEGFEKPKKVTAKSLRTDVRAAILSGIKLTIK